MPIAVDSVTVSRLLLVVIFGQVIVYLDAISTRADDGVIVAQVNGQPVYELEVARELRRYGRPGRDSVPKGDDLREMVLSHVIDRHLVLAAIRERQRGVSDQDVELEVSRMKKRVEDQGEDFDEYLRQRSLDDRVLRHTVAWQLAWQSYLDGQLSDENLQRYFDRHRRDFDGTQMRVAHILWKVNSNNDAEIARAKQAAASARVQIAAGQMTFAEAAKQYSEAPTDGSGGDVGFIRRGQPMSESFTAAAFALEAGQISAPVVSPAGVHLIQCIEIRPGTTTWQEVRQDLRKAASVYLFQWLAARERKKATIKIH